MVTRTAVEEMTQQAETEAKPKSKRMPDAVIIQRVSLIYMLLRDGKRKTSEILRSVAIAQGKEIALRKKHTESADKEKHPNPPEIWGDVAIPKRTLEYYVHKAKEQLEEEGRSIPRQGDYILGTQMARINDLYARALTAGKLAVCAKLIQEVNEMYGIRGTVRLHLTTDQSEATSDKELPEAELTEEQAMDEFTTWMQRIESRRAASKLSNAEHQDVEIISDARRLGAGA